MLWSSLEKLKELSSTIPIQLKIKRNLASKKRNGFTQRTKQSLKALDSNLKKTETGSTPNETVKKKLALKETAMTRTKITMTAEARIMLLKLQLESPAIDQSLSLRLEVAEKSIDHALRIS